jgi:hypothetical protein
VTLHRRRSSHRLDMRVLAGERAGHRHGHERIYAPRYEMPCRGFAHHERVDARRARCPGFD